MIVSPDNSFVKAKIYKVCCHLILSEYKDLIRNKIEQISFLFVALVLAQNLPMDLLLLSKSR